MISDPLTLSVVLLVVMFGLLLASNWIAFSLIGSGIAGMLIYDINLPPTLSIWDKIGGILANSVWNSLNSWALSALPLFILMGEILYRTAISTRLLNGLVPWLTKIPGRLYHINVVACSLFAAVSGSSAATTATVGNITLNELSSRGYHKNLALGSLAGAGTMGFLIPPSLIMIIYGVLSETSIGKLFIGGIIPGIMLGGLYSGFIAIRSLMHPEFIPPEDREYSWQERMQGIKEIVPVFLLIFLVLGGIYLGYTTPTEAAAIGVVGSLAIAAYFRNLTVESMQEAFMASVRTTCMICFIIAGAAFLSQVVGFIGIANALSRYIASLNLSPYTLIFVVGVMYLMLGMILDGISIVVMTLPIVLPIVVQAGWTPLWFGIYLVFMVELSQITPPVGFSLFVIQHISRENLPTILRATLPFFFIMILMVVIVTMVPEIVHFLPAQMSG